MSLPALLLALGLATLSFAHEGERALLGITARWESPSLATAEKLTNLMERLTADAGEYYDPDCLFRKRDAQNRCPTRFEREAALLSEACALYKEETLDFFDTLHRRQTPPQRDFGGVWQGHAIDQLKPLLPGPFVIDFAGDIFLSGPEATRREFILTDPVLDELKYATIRLQRGFVMTSVSRRLGGKVRVPDALAEKREATGEVLKVVLFAHPEFSGARLDAWSTAIVAGGTKVLRHLESLEKYQGQWEYFYFEPNGTPHYATASRHLKYEVDGTTRVITVDF